MADSPTSGDMFLARRFNFVGLPSERSGGALSYSTLRTELGDDNAAALVTKIGVLATVHGLDRLGIPLHHAVDRILQSLTPDERRTMAQGGAVPPRVEAIMSAEAETARSQQKQNGANIHGANAPPREAGDIGLGKTNRLMQSSARFSDISGQPSGASADSFYYKSLGLSDATGKALAMMGFKSPEEIKALVHDANTLGIDRNKGAVSLGMMKSDDPQNYQSHRHFFEHTYKPGLENIEQIDGQIATETDPARKAELIKKRDRAKAELEAKRQEQRKKSDGHKKAQKGFDDVSGQMQNSAKHRHELKPENARSLSRTDTRATQTRAEVQELEKVGTEKRAQSETTSEATTLAALDALEDDKKPSPREKLAHDKKESEVQRAALEKVMHAKDKEHEHGSAKADKSVKTVEKARPAKAPTPT
jgi:hypothetical protein